MTPCSFNQFKTTTHHTFSNSALLITLFQLQQRGVEPSTFRLARELGVSQQLVRVGLIALHRKGLVHGLTLSWFGIAAAAALEGAATRDQSACAKNQNAA